MATTATAHHDAPDHPTGWRRYLYSTNHKDIGTLYLVFALVAAIIGGSFSILMRMGLQSPGIQIMPLLAQVVHGAPPGQALGAGKNLSKGLFTTHCLFNVFFRGIPLFVGVL